MSSHQKIDPKTIGRLKSVTYEKDGQLIQVEWAKLKKVLISNQICLQTPDGVVLSVIRKGQL